MQQPSPYPSQDQPGPSPAFSTSHGNPYNQQRESYLPPNQYDMLMSQVSQGFTADPQRGSLSSELEVKQIEQRLSSGRYLCYNCWLYVMAIAAILTLIYLVFETYLLSPRTIIYAIEAFITLNYSVAMIGALKYRSLEKAKDGYKIAIACLFVLVACLGYDALVAFTRYTMKGIVIYLAVQVPVVGLYYFFVVMYPVLKIKEQLERRELLQQTSSSVPASVYAA